MKHDSKADAILAEIAKIAENSVKKYLDNAGRIAVVAENSVKKYLDNNAVAENAVAENSVKKYLDNAGRIAVVSENSVKKYLDNTVTENAVAENSVNNYLDNTVAENAVTDNGLIFSRIKKTAEDCLRNYSENNLESGIDITSMKKQLPIIDTKQKTKTVNQTILEQMNDIVNEPITKTINDNTVNEPITKTINDNTVNEGVSKTINDNTVNEGVSKTNNDDIVNEGVSKTNNDDIVNEGVSKTNNDDIVNEGVSKTNNINGVNESSEYINNYAIESNYDTTTDSAKIIKNTPILIEIARIAEESVKREMIKMPLYDVKMKSIPQKPKKDIRDDDIKQGIRELFVSPDTNSIVRNNDNGKDITNKKIFDSNTLSLPPLPTSVHDLSSVIDKSRVDDMMNEISKTAINAVMNKMGIKNNVDYTTRNDNTQDEETRQNMLNAQPGQKRGEKPIQDVSIEIEEPYNTQDEETRQHMLNAQPGQKRGEKPIQDVSIEIEEPIQDVSIETDEDASIETDEDASITIKDLSYSNDEKNDTTETTYLKVDPKDTGKFIITRKRR
jgi:hypothetical protein